MNIFIAFDHNFSSRNPSRSSEVSKDSDCTQFWIKTSTKYYHLTVWAQGQVKWAKQSGLKVLYLWHHSQKSATLTKKFCLLQTTRLAESFWCFNSSLALTTPEIFIPKATCNPAVFVQTAWINPAAEILKESIFHLTLQQILTKNCQAIRVRTTHILEVFQLSSDVNCYPTANNFKSFHCNGKCQHQILT